MMQGKMIKLDRNEEMKMEDSHGSPHSFIQSIRLPNMASSQDGHNREGFQSPTRILEASNDNNISV